MMIDYETFKTSKEAKQVVAKILGWNAKVIRLYLPDDPNANKDGLVWVIQLNGNRYLCRNGYVC